PRFESVCPTEFWREDPCDACAKSRPHRSHRAERHISRRRNQKKRTLRASTEGAAHIHSRTQTQQVLTEAVRVLAHTRTRVPSSNIENAFASGGHRHPIGPTPANPLTDLWNSVAAV
ncbi:unnamed protein product, partial [Ectocarpus sp. 13 AM-2016]